jgi:hypothetical protein
LQGEGVWADLIRQRFEKGLKRVGIEARAGSFARLDGSRFKRPAPHKETKQMDMFDQ